MKIVFAFMFIVFIVVESATTKRRSTSEDDFVRSKLPSSSNQKGKKNSPSGGNNDDDSFVRTSNPSESNSKGKGGSNSNVIEDNFVLSKKPNSKPTKKGEKVPSHIKTFWHISDLHLDFNYNHLAEDRRNVCPSSNGAEAINPGPYGDYRCDSPWKLVTASVKAMHAINPQPEFILWTGDNTPHTNDENSLLSEDKVLEITKNMTDLLRKYFPNVQVFPALGNHDWHPKNQMPIGSSSLLSDIADLWEDWLGIVEKDVFSDGGFYTLNSKKIPNLQIVVLNTNVWYSSNKLINSTYDEDPGGQFAYLRSVLYRAAADNMQVYIVGHIPPGYFELVDDRDWLYPVYSAKYIEIIREYHHVIAGQFFGHHHTDSFRIFNHEGRSISTAWLAPGVSPWMTTLPGVENGANNPGIRLFEFDKNTLMPTDYRQYYLDLQKANSDGSNEWLQEYRATDAFGLKDISNLEMENLYKTIKDADVTCPDCANNQLLQKYALYNSVSYNRNYCDRQCQKQHYCAIGELQEEGYLNCLNGAISINISRLWMYVSTALLLILVRQ